MKKSACILVFVIIFCAGQYSGTGHRCSEPGNALECTLKRVQSSGIADREVVALFMRVRNQFGTLAKISASGVYNRTLK